MKWQDCKLLYFTEDVAGVSSYCLIIWFDNFELAEYYFIFIILLFSYGFFGLPNDYFFFKGLLYPHLQHSFLSFIPEEKHQVLSIMDSHGEKVLQALQNQMVYLILIWIAYKIGLNFELSEVDYSLVFLLSGFVTFPSPATLPVDPAPSEAPGLSQPRNPGRTMAPSSPDVPNGNPTPLVH